MEKTLLIILWGLLILTIVRLLIHYINDRL